MKTGPFLAQRERACAAQRGFSLVELLVAMLIALFVIGSAMGTMLTQKRNLSERDRYAAVQEQQRLTAAVLDDLIQSAGYFPDPRTLTAAQAFAADSQFAEPGQSVVGRDGTSDSITVRSMASTAGTDPVMGCNGGGNGGAPGNRVVTSMLTLDPDTRQILCTTDSSTATPIIGGVESMRIRYGIDADSDGSVDGYATATQVGSQWALVRTVSLTLQFVNPYAAQGQTAPLELRRTIQLMNQARPG